MPVATSIVMDVVSFAWSREGQPPWGRIEAHNISRVPSPNCPMLSTDRRQQRIAFEPATAAQPWRREPLLMPQADPTRDNEPAKSDTKPSFGRYEAN